MKKRKPKQLVLFPLPIPTNVVVVRTDDLDLSTPEGGSACVERMMAVPMDKSILLDFLVGRKRGDPRPDEERIELYRLQMLLNARYHNKRFDFLGDSLTARMVRKSIREELWKPRFWKGEQS